MVRESSHGKELVYSKNHSIKEETDGNLESNTPYIKDNILDNYKIYVILISRVEKEEKKLTKTYNHSI